MRPPPESVRVEVVLDASAGAGDAAAVAAQIPEPATLASRAAVVVLGATARKGGRLARWLGPRAVVVPRALRCTALLARGYVRIGGGIDPDTGADLAWGWAPDS
jgi:hypothetical protein